MYQHQRIMDESPIENCHNDCINTVTTSAMMEHFQTMEELSNLNSTCHDLAISPPEDDSARRVHYISHIKRKRNLRPGDHIYVWRGLFIYQHHGIYTGEEGDQEVIHVNGHKFSKTSATVTSSSLTHFLNGGLLRLVSYDDSHTKYKIRGTSHTSCSRPAEQVVTTAKKYLNNPDSWGRYNLLTHNCETFAYTCKTGHDTGHDTVISEERERSLTGTCRLQGTGFVTKHLLSPLIE